MIKITPAAQTESVLISVLKLYLKRFVMSEFMKIKVNSKIKAKNDSLRLHFEI